MKHSKKNSSRIYPALALISAAFLLIALQLSSKQISSLEVQTASADEASLTPKRFTKLGETKTIVSKKGESQVIMNDPTMSQNWGLKKIDSQAAWRVSMGSKDVTVAIVDTGIDAKHADLRNNLWTNKGETGFDSKGRDKASNGIDDDGNGFTDDVHGWNFVDNTPDLKDNHGHGTHIAGIIGAEGGNGIGISGVSPHVSLMILKYYDPKSSGVDNLKNTVAAIRYASKMGAHIINYSGGGLEFSKQEFEAVKEASRKQILFVAAAGNERSNSDHVKYYPADYDLPNIISVTAIDPRTNVLSTSNYGVQTVDIAAPGENIYSTLPDGKYGIMTGTSQATAFVSGVAALIKANNPEMKADSIAKYILKTGDKVPSLQAKVGTATKLNSYRSLSILDQGVSATGVMADNTVNMPASQFASDPGPKVTALDEQGSTEEIASFSRDLMQNLKQSVGPASATPPPAQIKN
jgi:thermitase